LKKNNLNHTNSNAWGKSKIFLNKNSIFPNIQRINGNNPDISDNKIFFNYLKEINKLKSNNRTNNISTLICNLKGYQTKNSNVLNDFSTEVQTENFFFIKQSRGQRRELLYKDYQLEFNLLPILKEKIKKLLALKNVKLGISRSKKLLDEKSPYNISVITNKKLSLTKKAKKNADILSQWLSKNLNYQLDDIWISIVTNKHSNSIKKNTLEKTENFSSEYKDAVQDLNKDSNKLQVDTNSKIYEESFLKSCNTKSLNFLNQASLKIDLNKLKNTTSKGTHYPNSNEIEKELEDNKINSDEKEQEIKYENLFVFLNRKKWVILSNGGLEI